MYNVLKEKYLAHPLIKILNGPLYCGILDYFQLLISYGSSIQGWKHTQYKATVTQGLEPQKRIERVVTGKNRDQSC